MAYKLYQKLISAMANEGVCNASDVDMSASVNGQSYSKAGAIINAIISFINGLRETLSNLVGTGLKREIVQALPTENISDTTIYLILKKPAGTSGDIYDEYMYINNAWEHIGSTEVDLTNYVQKPNGPTSDAVYAYKNGQMEALDSSEIPFADGGFTSTNVLDAIIEVREENNIDYTSLYNTKVPYPASKTDNKQYVMFNGQWVEVQIATDAANIAFVNTGTLFTATNVQTALQELKTNIVGRYIEDLPSDSNYPQDIEISEVNNGIIPKDGTHYHFGSISGLVIGNEIGAMKLGTTLHFSASADFTIILPYSYTNDGQTYNPAVPARMIGADKMSCISDSEYILTITCVCGASGNPINLFNLQELTTPTASSNDIS